MAEDSSEEKTEAPSDKRRQESREKGNVAKSNEVNSVLVLLTAFFMFRISGNWIMDELKGCLIATIRELSNTTMDTARVTRLFYEYLSLMGKLTLPIAGMILIIGVVSNIIQVGFLFTLKPLMPDFEKINPISGFKRVFSMRSIVETIKSIAKLTVIAWVAWETLKDEFPVMMMLADASVLTIWNFTINVAYKLIIRTILVLSIIAILDFAFQRYDHEKKMKMTKQEIKDEHKQMEGDPQVKGRLKAMRREMLRRRMMDQVPKASVVVTNPTHIAIALLYDPEKGDAPIVVAKGKRLIAQRIKEIASKAGVPLVEDKPLARAMYDKIEIGSEIPMEFFTAIAEIMAYVFRLKRKNAA